MAETLTEVLHRHGYTHRRAARAVLTGQHDILNKVGTVVFTGTAGDVWEWLNGLEQDSGQDVGD